MIVINNTLVSDLVIEKKFVCNLDKCKGACCVDGDSGAPLEENETEILETIYDKVKPYMEPDGIAAIEQQGKWITDSDGDKVTPLLENQGRCAYVFIDPSGVAKCAIEKAFYDGKIDFKKPVSCHLYPIRINQTKTYIAVNYDQRDVCKPACANGKALGVYVFEFLKEPLIRKFGTEWYKQLEGAVQYINDNESEK